ncbi:MAG: FAD/NAD(P)-binding protein [Planctomycetota bacterium]
MRIRNVIREIPGVATYDLEFADVTLGNAFRFRSGQFNMLYLPGVGESAISISSDPRQAGVLLHTIRVAGNVTRALESLPVGATLGLRGPFGSHWPVELSRGRHVVLVTGGIGLAPLRPVIHELLADRNHYRDVTLLIGARDPSGLLYAGEYDSWRAGGMRIEVTVDRADETWHGHVGMVTTLLDRLPLSGPSETVLMTCGPEVMMWYTIQLALKRGVRSDSIYVSLERNMNCAIGLCGHCQFGPEFLCKDGPVFSYERVASLLKVEDL